MLSRRQSAIAHACGSVSGRDRDKCGELPLYETCKGFFYLAGGLSSTACRVRETIAQGSHTIVIADLLEGDTDIQPVHVELEVDRAPGVLGRPNVLASLDVQAHAQRPDDADRGAYQRRNQGANVHRRR
jgi:flavin reductase (DIM6/NTAB) family NADH-FMN oxidoreductase RutF